MNVLDVADQQRILTLLGRSWSIRRVARETGYRHETIRRYGIEAGILKPGPGAKCTTASEVPTDPKPHTGPEVPTDSAATRSSAEPFRAFIEAELAKRRNATAIYQDLVEHHGYTGSYDAIKRLARELRKREPKVSCRFETEPGQELQVDYGEGALTRDPRTGKYRRPRLFTLTLGNSRHAFQKAVWNSSTETWCKLHEEGFAYFGGATHTIRFDNLKEGVLKPDIYDPQLNPLYAKMLEHYGIVPLPCRPYAPDLKGKVESAVGYVQETALKGKRFESIEEHNEHLARWNDRWAATRIHGTTKRQVRAMFEEEKPFLLPLPPIRFEYYRICQRTVHFDGYIEVESAYYSAPPRYVGHKVTVHVGRLWLRMLDPSTQQCIREHPIALHKGQRRTIDADRPKQTPVRVEKLAARIAGAGPGCEAFAQKLVEDRGAVALRAQSDRRCAQRLAKPRSLGRTQRAHGVRRPSKRARPIQPHVSCAASRCSSAGVGIARRACRRLDARMDCERSRRLARRSQRRLLQATIHDAAPR
jgi:transposase